MSYVSEELFHFVGSNHPSDHEANYQILLKVLDEGWITHLPHHHVIADSVSFDLEASLESGELINPKMTCYCDIPLTSIEIHARKYGYFGVGLDRAKLISMGARPVTYIPTQPSDWRGSWGTIHGLGFLKDLEGVWRGAWEFVNGHPDRPASRSMGIKPKGFEETSFALNDLFTRQLAFTKAFNSELPADHPENYYMEREWRKVGNFQFEDKDLKAVLLHESFASRFATDRQALAHLAISLPFP